MVFMYSKPVAPSLNNADSKERNQALYLAALSLMNGSVPEAKRNAALRVAQSAGVTTTEYLRARILIGTGAVRPDFISIDVSVSACIRLGRR
jgi:hypothetical protein